MTIANAGTAAGTVGTSLNGPDSAQFDLVSDACDGTVLAPSDSCDVVIRFAPSLEGAHEATLTASAGDGAPVSANIAGIAVADARIGSTTTVLDFAASTVGALGLQLRLTVTNDGDVPTGALNELIVGDAADDFAVTQTSCAGAVLASAESCTVDVQFTPTQVGARAASLEVSASPGGALIVALTGNGLAPGDVAVVPESHDFGAVLLGGSGTHVFNVSNNGGSPTDALSLVISGADASNFTIEAGADGCSGVTLASSSSCSVTVRFTPALAGAKAAVLTVDGGVAGVATASLTGSGQEPADLSLDRATINFGSTALGTASADVIVTVTNVGDASTGVPSATLGGADAAQFRIAASTCTASLAGAATCTVTLHYQPTALASHAATLTVSASPGGSEVVQLQGDAVDNPLDLLPVWYEKSGVSTAAVFRSDGRIVTAPFATPGVASAADFTVARRAREHLIARDALAGRWAFLMTTHATQSAPFLLMLVDDAGAQVTTPEGTSPFPVSFGNQRASLGPSIFFDAAVPAFHTTLPAEFGNFENCRVHTSLISTNGRTLVEDLDLVAYTNNGIIGAATLWINQENPSQSALFGRVAFRRPLSVDGPDVFRAPYDASSGAQSASSPTLVSTSVPFGGIIIHKHAAALDRHLLVTTTGFINPDVGTAANREEIYLLDASFNVLGSVILTQPNNTTIAQQAQVSVALSSDHRRAVFVGRGLGLGSLRVSLIALDGASPAALGAPQQIIDDAEGRESTSFLRVIRLLGSNDVFRVFYRDNPGAAIGDVVYRDYAIQGDALVQVTPKTVFNTTLSDVDFVVAMGTGRGSSNWDVTATPDE